MDCVFFFLFNIICVNVLVTYIIKHAGLVKANKQIINEGNTLTHCDFKTFSFSCTLG